VKTFSFFWWALGGGGDEGPIRRPIRFEIGDKPPVVGDFDRRTLSRKAIVFVEASDRDRTVHVRPRRTTLRANTMPASTSMQVLVAIATKLGGNLEGQNG
jgi:hypothetical protein